MPELFKVFESGGSMNKYLMWISFFAFTASADGNHEDVLPNSQEYVDRATLCSFLFSQIGNDELKSLSLFDALGAVDANKKLEVQPTGKVREEFNAQVSDAKKVLGNKITTDRDAAFYLISENKCLLHTAMGGASRLLLMARVDEGASAQIRDAAICVVLSQKYSDNLAVAKNKKNLYALVEANKDKNKEANNIAESEISKVRPQAEKISQYTAANFIEKKCQ